MDTTPQKYHRGDIYYANLEPHLGCEQGGIRPVLVVQNDVGNKHSKTLIVSALTSRTATKAKLPTHVFLRPHPRNVRQNPIPRPVGADSHTRQISFIGLYRLALRIPNETGQHRTEMQS